MARLVRAMTSELGMSGDDGEFGDSLRIAVALVEPPSQAQFV